ncbi:MAG: hypothetical protein ABSB15_13365 [Bryobacteraceae bacterium]
MSDVIQPQAKIYIDPASGFDTYLSPAIERNRLSVIIVTDKSKADYELEAGVYRNDEAGIRLVNVSTSQVVFAFSWHKNNSAHGRLAAAESCAKHLKAAMTLPGANFR